MTRSARGGWNNLSVSGYRTVAAEPAEPTAWENLLRELSLPEEQAVIAIRSGSALGARLNQFARKHFCVRYVPEPVLAELGLSVDAVDGTASFYTNKGRRMGRKGELK